MTEPSEADRTSTAAAALSPDDLFAAALTEAEPAPAPAPVASLAPLAVPEPPGPAPTPPALAAAEPVRDVPTPGPATASVPDTAAAPAPLEAMTPAPPASLPVEPALPLPDLSDPPPDEAGAADAESLAQADAPTVLAASGALVPAELVAIVRAWQHRHPLARRLRAEDVGYVGLVALPYFSPADAATAGHGGLAEPDLGDLGLPAHVAEVIPTLADAPAPDRVSPPDVPPASPPTAPALPVPARAGWRERAMQAWARLRARLRLPGGHHGTTAAGGWVPGFDDEPLIDGVTAADLARFASRHAFDEPPGEADWPTRALTCQPGRDIHAAHWRFLMTVALRVPGGEPVRVLIGRSRSDRRGRSATPILGARPLDRRRQAVAVLLGTVLLTALGAGAQRWRAGGHAAADPGADLARVAAAASAASTSAASSDVAAPAPATAASRAAAAASEVASASATATPAPAGAALAESAASATMPAPQASSPDRTGGGPVAASAVPSAPAPVSPAAPPLAARPAPAAEPPGPGQPQAARTTGRSSAVPAPPEPVRHALVSRPQGQPAAARALAQRLRQALGPEGAALRVEVMDTASGPVVTVWPVVDEREAERLALAFTRAGVPMRVQSF